MEEQYYTVTQVAQRFQVKRATVYNWMKSGKLKYVVVGGDRRITGTAINDFVKPGQAGSEEPKSEEPERHWSDFLATPVGGIV